MSTSPAIIKQVGFASIIMMVSVFASRIIGLGREMAIAYFGGAGSGVDAYQVAFIIPEILNHCVASGFLSITFIPIFSDYLARDKEKEGWQVFSLIFNSFGLLLLVLIAIALFYAPQLVTILAPGLDDPDHFEKAVAMTRIIIPAQFFFFTGGMFMAVQFAKKKFLIPALAPLVYNLGIIGGGLLLGPHLGMEGFAWGVLGGAFIGNFLIQYFGARSLGLRLSPSFDLGHPALKTYLFLTLPLMLGLTMTFSTEILLKYFGSFLDPGSIAALNYALRIMFLLVGLFGQAVGVASYPFMAGLAALDKIPELNRLFNSTIKFLMLVIPVSVLFMVLKSEIVMILFQRGEFDIEATQLTAGILPYLMAGSVAFCLQTVVNRGFYAIQNTWFPALMSTLSVMISLPLFYGLTAIMGIRGVALALSLAAMLQTIILFECWNRKSDNRDGRMIYRFFIKIVLISIGLGLVLGQVKKVLNHLFDSATVPGAFLICSSIGLLFALLFGGSGYLFKITEIHQLYGKLKKRLGGARRG